MSTLTEQQLEEFREAFNLFDRDGDGAISALELGTAMRSLGANPTEREIKDMMDRLDVDEKGTVDFKDFCELMEEKLQDENAPTEESLKAAFKVFDKDDSGFISAQELIQIMKSLGEPLSKTEISDMMAEAGIDQDGQVNYSEFVRLILGE
ncbi:unnamed protein product [Pedinophyceae sp. YPF-701]|nr:unnamed protein product [Pedinophyceae sp. YPF-701]